MRKITCALMIMASVQIQAQSNIRVGGLAPTIHITDWIANVPKDKSLKGKNIVLEFWATWCGPCIAAVPHLNGLQGKYKNPDLYFISLTDESVDKVNRILKRVDFKSIVASDQTRQTQISFGDGKKDLDAYPLTVLIDKNGVVRWIGEPRELNESIMGNFLKPNETSSESAEPAKAEPKENKDTGQPDENDFDKFMRLMKDKELMYHLEFRKTSQKKTTISKFGNVAFFYSALTLRELYADLTGVDAQNIESTADIDGQKYLLLYKNKKKNPESIAQLGDELLSLLKLDKKTEARTVAAIGFRVKEAKSLEKALDETSSSKSEAGEKIIFTSYTVVGLIHILHCRRLN